MNLSKPQIIEQLNQKSKDLLGWYSDRTTEVLTFAPEEAWTAGQHLLHLIKSTKPLGRGMAVPRFLLRLKFGKVEHDSRSYEATVQSYQDALSNGGKAMGEYVPREVNASEKEALLGRFEEEMQVLITQVGKWSEKNLDNTAVPHPLIGKLTLREMLYFTIYHMEHHLKTLEEKYT